MATVNTTRGPTLQTLGLLPLEIIATNLGFGDVRALGTTCKDFREKILDSEGFWAKYLAKNWHRPSALAVKSKYCTLCQAPPPIHTVVDGVSEHSCTWKNCAQFFLTTLKDRNVLYRIQNQDPRVTSGYTDGLWCGYNEYMYSRTTSNTTGNIIAEIARTIGDAIFIKRLGVKFERTYAYHTTKILLALERNQSIVSFDLDCESFLRLADHLKGNQFIYRLSIVGYQVRDAAFTFGRLMPPPIPYGLPGDPIHYQVQAPSECLGNYTLLTKILEKINLIEILFMGETGFDAQAVHAMVLALDESARLEVLDLNRNGLSSSCVTDLIRIIDRVPTLNVLTLVGNHFSDLDKKCLCVAASRRSVILYLG